MSEFLLVTLTSEEAVNVRDKLNIISTQFRSLMKICVTYMTRLEGITSPGGLSSDQVSQSWLSLVRQKSGKFKVREFCAGSGKFEILRKVREIQENPLKDREILLSHVIRVTPQCRELEFITRNDLVKQC